MARGIQAGDRRAELRRPAADGLVGDDDPTLEQQLVDQPQAERETEVEPHRVGDELGWETVPLAGGGRGLDRPLPDDPIAPMMKHRQLTVTSPVEQWSLTIFEKLVKIGAQIVRHG